MGLEKRYLTIRNAALVYVALFLCNIISGSLKIYTAYYIYIIYKLYAFFINGYSKSQVWYFWIWVTIKFDWQRTKIVVEFMIPKSWWEKLIQKLQLNSGISVFLTFSQSWQIFQWLRLLILSFWDDRLFESSKVNNFQMCTYRKPNFQLKK